ncbi:MAG: 30S ribosomal protein S16 [Chloroflexi bacterium]|nr:30S ribosomal protein S16 [Chloroflexota bacterium]
MVRIRLRRVGLRNQPSYRVIAANGESPRDGKFLEILGNYNPRTQPFTLEVKEDRVYHWMTNGAQLSEPVERLFKNTGILDRFQRFKSGESLETLMAESNEYFSNRKVSVKTRLD